MSEVNEYYSKEFIALLDEALFTKDILGIGVTQLYKANYKEFFQRCIRSRAIR